MNSDELIVNIQCVEQGIIPIAGIPMGHIEISLKNLTHKNRRKCTRKFRKILKRAIKYLASEYYTPGSPRYIKFMHDYRNLTGLNRSGRSSFSREQRSFRHAVVVKYLNRVEL